MDRPMTEPLAVLWEDPHGLAVAKPAGLLTQGTGRAGEATLEDLVRRHLRPDDPASAYLGTVHRLDRPVSGVILWAKTPRAARRWADQFARREARKEYWAIVEGDASAARAVRDAGTTGSPRPTPRAGPGSSSPGRPGLGPGRRPRSRSADGRRLADGPGLAQAPARDRAGRTSSGPRPRPEGCRSSATRPTARPRPFPAGIALHARSLTVEHPIRRRPMVGRGPAARVVGGLAAA